MKAQGPPGHFRAKDVTGKNPQFVRAEYTGAEGGVIQVADRWATPIKSHWGAMRRYLVACATTQCNKNPIEF
jgi:hypothetical protein